jgi:hypothetical protein
VEVISLCCFKSESEQRTFKSSLTIHTTLTTPQITWHLRGG